MQRVVIGLGLPGSGKTTVLKGLAEADDLVYVCPDSVRAELTGDEADQSVNEEVWRVTYERVAEALAIGKGVVVDATNTEKAKRLGLVEWCRRNAGPMARIELWYFVASVDICKERNRKRQRVVPEWVIDRMWQQLVDEPIDMVDEGFDVLILVR